MPVFPSLPSLSPFISLFLLSSQLSRPTRAERFCHAGQWCLLWRLDVKSHSVAVTEGHSLLDTMFSSRIACHRTQYFKLLSLHRRSQSTESRLFDGVRAFEDIPEPNGWKLMYDLFTKTKHFAKGYKLFERLFEELGPIYKESVLLSPKTTVHVIEPEDIEKVFRAEGKYPRRMQLDIWLEYRKRRNYFPGLILLWVNSTFIYIINKLIYIINMITETFTHCDSYVPLNGRVCRGKSRNSGLVETRLSFEDLPKYDLIFLRNRHLFPPTHF